MQPQFKSVLWLTSQEAYGAAHWRLEEAGVELETNYSSDKIPFTVGTLKRSEGCPVKIYLFSLSGKPLKQERIIAETADAILLSGTCTGRPGVVKLGDIIGVTSSFHMDRGATHHRDGSVDFNISPVYAANTARSALNHLQQAKLEHTQAMPVSIETRRDWVLDYLNTAKMTLPMGELFPIATDLSLELEARNKQWKKCVLWLRDKGLISIENRKITLTAEGIDHCSKNVLASFVEQSKEIKVHMGTVVTSSSTQANLQEEEAWTKFDNPILSPVIGLDNDAYDMLREFPNLIVIKAVKVLGQDKVKGDKNNVIQKSAARALMHIILHL